MRSDPAGRAIGADVFDIGTIVIRRRQLLHAGPLAAALVHYWRSTGVELRVIAVANIVRQTLLPLIRINRGRGSWCTSVMMSAR